MGCKEEGTGPAATALAPDSREGGAPPPPWPLPRQLLLFAVFAAIDFSLYHGVLRGEFVSDDFGYIVTSPYTRELTAESILAMFQPFGAASLYTANYAPLHLLFTAIERNIFGADVLGYHLVNVSLHALNSVLLVALLRSSRLPVFAAVLGGLIFAVHPANVEAVAWISQLKTNGALALSLGALLALRRRPAIATALFAAGLLVKASAFFALPMAAVLAWARQGQPEGDRRWGWIGVWTLVFGLYAVPQLSSFRNIGEFEVPAYADPFVQLRSIAAIGVRYLVMVATSYGLSAYHEPEPVVSLLDPWWLAALPLAVLLGWRILVAFRNRSEEAAYWVGAAAGFAPVSQVFPFLIPMADRYLYFILPGLIGGTLFLFVAMRDRIAGPATSSRVAAALAAGLVVFFAIHTAARARLWNNDTLLLVDAARHYPEGASASLLNAYGAAARGDVEAAVTALRTAADRGIDNFMLFRSDPALAPVRGTEAFRDFQREMAGRWIERARRRENPTQPDLRMMAHAHLERGEYAEAVEALERALRVGGPLESVVRAELESVRGRQMEAKRRDASDGTQEVDGHRPKIP